MKRLFVTGTDTGVGKTEVTAALARTCRAASLTVAALKPIESGCDAVDGVLLGADAVALHAASAMSSPNCLYRLRHPLAPGVAAQLENTVIDWNRMIEWVRSFESERVLVEGAGGWFVPLTTQHFVSHMAVELDTPILVVCRPSLGTINHTLLTLSQVAESGCTLAGFLMSESLPTESNVWAKNLKEIQAGAALLNLEAPYWGSLRYSNPTLDDHPLLDLTTSGRRWLQRSA